MPKRKKELRVEIHPVQHLIREEMTFRGWTEEVMAEKIGRVVLDRLFSGSTVTARLDQILSRVFGNPVGHWTDLDRRYWQNCVARNLKAIGIIYHPGGIQQAGGSGRQVVEVDPADRTRFLAVIEKMKEFLKEGRK